MSVLTNCIRIFILIFLSPVIYASSQPDIEIVVLKNNHSLSEYAAQIFYEEIKKSKENDKQALFMLPTGSTPLGLYKNLVKMHKKKRLNLNKATYFNLDEYIGLEAEHENSYQTYLKKNFFSKFSNPNLEKKNSNIFLIPASKNENEAKIKAREYRFRINEYLSNDDYRKVAFTGLGQGPAHIAFNDFTDELQGLDEGVKTRYALDSKLRIVPLDKRTRNANKIYFSGRMRNVPKQAISIGMKEILACDHVVVLVSGAHKKKAFASIFKNNPSYKVPASLLRTTKKKLTFLIDKEAYTEIKEEGIKVSGLSSASNKKSKISLLIGKNSDFKNTADHIHKVSLYDGEKVLVVQDHPFGYISNYLRKIVSDKTTIHEINPDNYKEDEIFDKGYLKRYNTLFIPKSSRDKIQMNKDISDMIEKKGITVVFYNTPHSLIHSKNIFVGLEKNEHKSVEKALLHHSSQNLRTAFHEIMTDKAKKTLNSFQHVYPAYREESLNLEGLQSYRQIKIKNQKESQEEKVIFIRDNKLDESKFNKNDHFIIVSPHPDDAEIGASYLIKVLARNNRKTTVVVVTSGSHSKITWQSVSPKTIEKLGLKISDLNLKEEVKSPKIKAFIRKEESIKALKELNHNVEIKFLNLPFYDNNNKICPLKDEKVCFDILKESLEELRTNQGALYLVLPELEDLHKSHQISSQLFIKGIKKISRNEHTKSFDLIYYQTPWTTSDNLYAFTDHPLGERSKGIMLSELLGGYGKNSFKCLEREGKIKAISFEVK